MSKSPVMLDVDTGVDDAAAIAFALGMEADLVGISTVVGNVGIDASTRNTLKVLSLLGADVVPVLRGASRPLVATVESAHRHAAKIHGSDGFGGVILPEADGEEASLTAPEAIIAMAEEFAGDLVLVAVGPYTNIAIALSLRPELPKLVRRLVLMGGAFSQAGNVTPHAEYNIYTDPHAAQQVFAADWREIISLGLDVTERTAISREMWEAIPADAEGSAWLIKSISERHFAEDIAAGFYLHDPLAVGVALDDSLVTTESCFVDVVLDGEERGKTVTSAGGNVRVARTVDSRRFLQRFCEAVNIPFIPAAESGT